MTFRYSIRTTFFINKCRPKNVDLNIFSNISSSLDPICAGEYPKYRFLWYKNINLIQCLSCNDTVGSARSSWFTYCTQGLYIIKINFSLKFVFTGQCVENGDKRKKTTLPILHLYYSQPTHHGYSEDDDEGEGGDADDDDGYPPLGEDLRLLLGVR